MSIYTRYCIPLKKSILIFFPECHTRAGADRAEGQECLVVQVMIRQSYKDVVKELTTFFLAQFEITKAVESVLYAHIITQLPEEVCIEGPGYVLHGRRKPWDYGKTLNLMWGEKSIRPCPDKWTFVFEVPKV